MAERDMFQTNLERRHHDLSLPIPDAAGTISYGDLSLNGNSFGKLVSDLNAKRKTENKDTKRLSPADRAHLDPDLIEEVRQRKPGWGPAYGQCGKDTTILRNHDVRSSSIRFFGWFRRCELAGETYRFLPGEPDLHVIFGYLKVRDVIRVSHDPVPEWAKDHPHLHGTENVTAGNTLFLAADRLGLPGASDLPGAAAFAKFTDKLQLTAPGMTRSWWRLPKWVLPRKGSPAAFLP